jgi:hypothetical protein
MRSGIIGYLPHIGVLHSNNNTKDKGKGFTSPGGSRLVILRSPRVAACP